MIVLSKKELKNITGGTWASVAVAGATTAYGISQKIKGDKLAKSNVRPTYQVPDEIKGKLSNAQNLALEGLPAAQKEQYINNIQRSSNFGLNALSDRKSGIEGLGALVQNQNDAYSDLLSKDASARQSNQQYLGNVQSEMAGYKDQAFNVNQMQPYEQKAAAARALTGAGIQNISGGLGSLSDSASQAKLLNNSTTVPTANTTTTGGTTLRTNFGQPGGGIGMNTGMGLGSQNQTQQLLNGWALAKQTNPNLTLQQYQQGMR